MQKFTFLIAVLSLAGQPAALRAQNDILAIDFGDDSGMYTEDQECDDPRFVGRAMGAGLLTDNIGRDATDCRSLFKEDQISFSPLFAPLSEESAINYGDDDGDFAADGECDDIRFTRPSADDILYMVSEIGHDAADCRAAVEAGTAQWQGESIRPAQQFMFKDQMTD